MLKKLVFICFLMLCLSCAEGDKREEEISQIPVEVDITRFEKRFEQATPDSLAQLKREFPYLFPARYPDSVWVEMMNDTIQEEIHREVRQKFSDLSDIEAELESLFQHVKYYFPNADIPQVVTLTSEVDYRNKVIWHDNLLLVALDTYLGEDHHFYLGIQEYIKKNFEPEMIVSDAADAFAENQIPRPSSRRFLSHLIYYGKILYLNDVLIPFKTDAQKIGYRSDELEWAEQNEEQIWRYFVDRELLYSSDSQLHSRFLFPAPFSKFYLELDSEAPPKLGQFIGWQIVRQFMDKNQVSIQEMIAADAETIFKNSNYKPRK